MGLFKNLKKKLNIISPKNWDDISVKKFYELVALGQNPKLEDLLKIVYEVDIKDIPIKDITKYKLDFINKDIRRKPIQKTYNLQGTIYNACFELPSISAAQFFDFRNYSKKNDFVGVLSCCLIPNGHEYNDGYDIEKVREDIENMPITEAQTVSFFFLNQAIVLFECTQQFSLKWAKEAMKDNTEITNLLNRLEEQGLSNSTSFH